ALENGLRLSLNRVFGPHFLAMRMQVLGTKPLTYGSYEDAFAQSEQILSSAERKGVNLHNPLDEVSDDLLSFFADRLKVQLREQGARHDLVDAVFALGNQDDLVMVVRRVEALGKFLDTEDGKNLLAGTKRAANILRIEEKKDERSYVQKPDPQF